MIRRFSDLYEDVLRKSGFRHASVRPSYADHPYTCPFKIRMTRYCNGRRIPFYVPCGRCLYCQQHRADDWLTRQLCESSVSTQVFFTTLTYDDPHLEDISRYTLQCFFKRLRKAGLVFRYIALSEYGPKTCRSHYHILFFLNSVKHFSCPAHFSRWISFFWRRGNVDSKEPTRNHHKYIAGYSKELFVDTPSFKLYSLRPGIGKNTDYYRYLMDYWANTGERSVTTGDGDVQIPYSCILDWRKMNDIEADPPDMSDFKPTRRDIEHYLYDLQQAYSTFSRRKL